MCEDDPCRSALIRSEITLKALTFAPTGGIVAAVEPPSLPETLGAQRATGTTALLSCATHLDADRADGGRVSRRSRGVARPELLQRRRRRPVKLRRSCTAPAGERSIEKSTRAPAWLSGYENSQPVRVGNAASGQFQLDVYGEVISALHESRRSGMDPGPSWDLELVLLDFLEDGWRQRRRRHLREVRGPALFHRTPGLMAWVAMDRAVKDVEQYGYKGVPQSIVGRRRPGRSPKGGFPDWL